MSYGFQQSNSLGYQLPDFAKPVTPASYKPDTNYASVVDLYPGLDDKDREDMNTAVQALPIQQQAVEKQKIYEQKVKEKQQQQFMDSRVAAKNGLYIRTQQEKDPVQKNNMSKTYKMANIADLARERMDIPAHITDQEIVDRVIGKVPNGDRLFMDYMNNKNDNLITLLNNAPGGKQDKKVKEEEGFLAQSAEDIGARFSSFYDSVGDMSLKDLLPNMFGGNRMLLRGAGALAGSANDVLGNAISSLTKSIGLDKPIGEAIKSITDTEIGQKGLELYQQGAEAFKSFEAVHPKQAQDIKDVWQLAQFAPIPGLASTKVGQQALNTAGDVVGTVAKAPLRAVSRILPSAEDTLTRLNRLTKGEIASFTKSQGVSPGKWLNDRGFVTAGEDTLEVVGDNIGKNIKMKADKLATITNSFTSPELVEMAQDSARYAVDTLNPKLERMKELASKVKNGLNGTEAQEVISFYQRNNKFAYGRDLAAGEKMARATNIDDAVRDQMIKFADDNGVPGLRELNKEIQASKFILDKLGKNIDGTIGNDFFTLSDYVIGAGTSFDPTAIVIGKVAKSDWFRKRYVDMVNWSKGHKTIRERVAAAEELANVTNAEQLDNVLSKDNIGDNLQLTPKDGNTTAIDSLSNSNSNTPEAIGQPLKKGKVKAKGGKGVGFNQAEQPAIPKQVKNTKTLAKSEKGTIIDSNSSIKTKDMQDLYTEARKYKSAEEFVKSQGNTLYHGTNRNFEEFDIEKAGSIQYSDWGKGVYFDRSKSGADYYRMEAVYNENPKLLEARKKLEKIDKTLKPRSSVDSTPNYTEERQNALAEVKRIKKEVESKGGGRIVEAYLSKDAKIYEYNSVDGMAYPALGEQIKDKGYDAIIIDKGRMTEEIVILNTSKIKTESQLRKIREGAQVDTKTPTTDLYTEARKYKSAEDMILGLENNGKITYHGTDADIKEFSTEFIGKGGDSQRVEGAGLGNGIYLTDKPQEAKYYADLVAKQNRDSTYRLEDSSHIKKINEMFDKGEITKEQYKEMFEKGGPKRDDFSRSTHIIKAHINGKIAKDKDIKDIFGNKLPKKYINDGFGKRMQIINQESINKALIDKGFIGREESYNMAGQKLGGKESANNIVIFDPKNIKTESQLRKIREEANKK